MITHFLTKNKLGLVGIVLGGLLGYAYYYFIGCNSGACAITSKPLNSSIYGVLMGYLLLSTFEKSTKKEK
jgi:C4-dicarboxylate transporter